VRLFLQKLVSKSSSPFVVRIGDFGWFIHLLGSHRKIIIESANSYQSSLNEKLMLNE